MKEFLLQTGIFMLLGKTILHFCPNEKYEKYLKLLFEFMIVIQFIAPFLSLGKGELLEKYMKNQTELEREFEMSMEEAEDKWFLYEKKIEKQIKKEQQKAEKMLQEQEKEAKQKEQDKTERKAETGQGTEKEIEISQIIIEVSGYE